MAPNLPSGLTTQFCNGWDTEGIEDSWGTHTLSSVLDQARYSTHSMSSLFFLKNTPQMSIKRKLSLSTPQPAKKESSTKVERLWTWSHVIWNHHTLLCRWFCRIKNKFVKLWKVLHPYNLQLLWSSEPSTSTKLRNRYIFGWKIRLKNEHH